MKRIITILLAVTAVIAATAICAVAYGGNADGVTWEIKDGVLTVTGGDIPDYTASSAAPWLKFSDDVTSLVIGSGVTRIGNRAFEDMKSLTSVNLGSAAVIGNMAFSGCTALTKVTLPNTVTEIGSSVFAECRSLAEVSLSAILSSMGSSAFEGCPALTTFSGGSARYNVTDGVIIDTVTGSVYRCPPARSTAYTAPAGITKIDSGAFRDCAALPSVNLTGITEIGDGAFYGCKSLTELTGTESITKIGMASFFGCGFKRVVFSDSLTAVGDRAFSGCASLKYITLGSTAPSVGTDSFAKSTVVIYKPGSTGYTDAAWGQYTTECYLPGDADGNGKVNMLDASAILKYLAGWNVTIRQASSDTNGDGRIIMLDVSNLLKYLAGWDIKLGF